MLRALYHLRANQEACRPLEHEGVPRPRARRILLERLRHSRLPHPVRMWLDHAGVYIKNIFVFCGFNSFFRWATGQISVDDTTSRVEDVPTA